MDCQTIREKNPTKSENRKSTAFQVERSAEEMRKMHSLLKPVTLTRLIAEEKFNNSRRGDGIFHFPHHAHVSCIFWNQVFA